MPTYEYKCRACANRFEVVQSFADDPLRVCDECGGELGKVFGNIGISFKGSGFYKTDSRSSAKTTKANGKEKGESKSESKSESKTESKSSDSKPSKGSESKSGTKSDAPKPAAKGSDKK